MATDTDIARTHLIVSCCGFCLVLSRHQCPDVELSLLLRFGVQEIIGKPIVFFKCDRDAILCVIVLILQDASPLCIWL